jgi:hypothetical protein
MSDNVDSLVEQMSALELRKSKQNEAYYKTLALDQKRKQSAKVLQRTFRAVLRKKQLAANAAKPSDKTAKRLLLAKAAESRRGGRTRRR